METLIENTNIDKIILGYKTSSLLYQKIDVFTILDMLKVDLEDLENPNYIILFDVLYAPVLGRQIMLPEEIFINSVLDLLISRKYIALFSNYTDAINDIKFADDNFNQEWWDEYVLKTSFNFNSI